MEHFIQQAERVGLDFERISAIDGDLPDVKRSFEELQGLTQPIKLGLYEFACLQSHRKAWMQFLSTSDKFSLILEDDIILSERFTAYNDDSWIPPGIDIVRLETFRQMIKIDREVTRRIEGRRLNRLRGSFMGAGAYILSRTSAALLLKTTSNPVHPVDVEMFSTDSTFFHTAVILQMIPAPAIQGDKLEVVRTEGWAQSSLRSERQSRVAKPPEHAPAIVWKARYWRRRITMTLCGYTDVPYR